MYVQLNTTLLIQFMELQLEYLFQDNWSVKYISQFSWLGLLRLQVPDLGKVTIIHVHMHKPLYKKYVLI
jgi:hypothetical protein